MGRKIFIPRLILGVIFLGFLLAGRPVEAQAPPKSDTVGSQETVRKAGLKNPTNGQVAVEFSRDEIDSIAAALPEGEAKQMFTEKVATGAQKDNAPSDEGRPSDPLERVRSGEEYSRIFFESEKAFSDALKQLYSYFTESTIDSREWAAALDNLNMAKGFIILSIPNLDGSKNLDIKLSLRKNVIENANMYYERGKSAKDKHHGAEKALTKTKQAFFFCF